MNKFVYDISGNANKVKHVNFWEKPNMNFQEKMMFVKQLSIMIKMGTTIVESLQIIIKQTKLKKNKKMYEKIIEMIESGQTLSVSLKEYDYIFSNIFINMIKTGEESGNLEKVLEYLDIQLEKEYELRGKVISAIIYPVVIIGITLLMTLGIVIFIMPKITKIFQSFKVTLPLVTRLLIGISSFIIEKPFITLFSFVGIILFFKIIFGLKSLKPFWDKVIIHLPVFGKIMIATNLARFNRTVSSLLKSGVPIIKALEVTGGMLDNSLYKEAIDEARDKVEKGGNLGESFNNEKLFPIMFISMLYIGERSGSLEVTTERLADLYERNVDAMTKNLSVLLEPFLLVFMAIMVGGIALSIILPIYQLPNLLHK